MGLLNGLSAMGASVAQFAGTAGLEQQKSDLAKQSMMLADQLATTRESAGRQEAGSIAATAAQKSQEFQAGQTAITEAGATARSAATNTTSRDVAGIQAGSAQTVAGIQATSAQHTASISAAAQDYATNARSNDLYLQLAQTAPEAAQRVLQEQQATALATVQAETAKAAQTDQNALADEQKKATPDPDVVSRLQASLLARGNTANIQMENRKAAAAVYTTDMQAVTRFQQDVINATKAYNDPEISDTDKAQAKSTLDGANQALTGARVALRFSQAQAHPEMSQSPRLPPPGAPPGGAWSATGNLYRDPQGKLFDPQGKPATAPGQVPPPASGIINAPTP